MTVGRAVTKRKRTKLGTLIDQDKYRSYKEAQMLFTVRWLERHPFIKWVLVSWIDKPWRGKSIQ